MRVLMLGWEFPPAVSGGVGTACLGLTTALAQRGSEITFLLPHCPDSDAWSKVEVVGVQTGAEALGVSPKTEAPAQAQAAASPDEQPAATDADSPEPSLTPSTPSAPALPHLPHVEFVPIEALLWPYRRPAAEATQYGEVDVSARHDQTPRHAESFVPPPVVPSPVPKEVVPPRGRVAKPPECVRYDDTLFTEIQRYAHLAARAATRRDFDVIHAHDWMTFPAAQMIADATGKPLVAHVHSTEFDRRGKDIDQRIYDIERAGLDRADLVVAVSHMTRGILLNRYSVPANKMVVIYNAVGHNGTATAPATVPPAIERDEKIVLFMGRITMQKGPEYFLAAARKVLQVYSKVRFVMAGAGDAVQEIMNLAEDLGIAEKVVFTGFLRGDDVERVFRSADLYVMPSVSDPFGISSLEAISYDVPALVSKQSGVSELLRHVLKVDFWDIEEMANKIVAVLRHPPLQATLKTQAGYEVRRLTWDDAAQRCLDAYQVVLGNIPDSD